MKEYKLYIGGEWVASSETMEITNPYNGEVIAKVHRGQPEHVEEATRRAAEAFRETQRLAAYQREAILIHISRRIAERKEEIARTMALEAGKPIRDSRLEAGRAVNTFKIAAEEAKRIGGELIPLDWAPGHEGRLGITRRFPIGPVVGISPFNFPLNLVAHKVAPALAAGNPIVMKPASYDPLCSLILAEIIQETEWPKGGFSLIPCAPRVAEAMVLDPRFHYVTFTGSMDVGWDLKARAGKKRVTLELGGNAGAIVHDDADLDWATRRCAVGSFAYAGQICISVQRLFAQGKIYEPFMDQFLNQVSNLKVGDPLDESTDVGPMISEQDAKRIEGWIQEATAQGAKVVCGGKREGNLFQPTVLINVKPDMKVCCLEAFAPIVNVIPYGTFEEAVRAVDDSPYGLQAGIFTQDLKRIFHAFENIQVGGLIVNDVPNYRIDHMPYGGVKDSGFGREGLKYAIDEMTEIKLLALNLG